MPKRLFSAVALALPLALAFVWISSEAAGRRTSPAAYEPGMADEIKVGVVNLDVLLQQTNEAAKWEVHLKTLRESIETEKKAKQAELSKIEEDLGKETDEAKKQALLDEGFRKKLLADEWVRLKEVELDRESALRWQSMYRTIREEIKAVSEASGIDLVLVNDETAEPKANERINQPRELQVLEKIFNSKVLFANKRVDITTQVKTRIDNKTKSASTTAEPSNTSAL